MTVEHRVPFSTLECLVMVKQMVAVFVNSVEQSEF